MKRILRISFVVIIQTIIIQNTIGQSNSRITFTYDSNGNRTAFNVAMIRVDEDAIRNDSIFDSNLSGSSVENYQDIINGINISLYPNPTCGSLMLSTNTNENYIPIDISLLSFGGNIIDKKTLTGQNIEIDMTGCSPGVYFVVIHSQGEKHVWKIIKSN